MFRKCIVSRMGLLAASPLCLNFFPLGLKSGPKNYENELPINNLDPKQEVALKKVSDGANLKKRPGYVTRDEMKLHCECCRFEWAYDTLTVRCTAHPTVHNQREIWLQPTWMWNRQQPYKYYQYLPTAKNPRTHQLWAREDAKGMNCERRAVGLTAYSMNVRKQVNGIARSVSNIGNFSSRWQTRFPFPT